MAHCYILDYSCDMIFHTEIENCEDNDKVEEHLIELGFNTDEISYMTSDAELEITNVSLND